MKFNKVFGIGLNKTGTSSLNKALNILGIRSLHDPNGVPEILKYEKKNNLKTLSTLNEFKGFSDYPFDKIFKELDKAHPNSKFILTIRDLKSWLISRKNHVLRNQKNPNYKGWWLKVNIPKWIRAWKKHNADVREYFKNRPDDLLIIDICNGEGWGKLCPFLDLPIPNQPFPHKNENIEKTIKKHDFLIELLTFFKR
jgi:hypothetical protein